MMSGYMQLTIDKNNVAHLVLDTPDSKANIINIPFMEEFERHLEALQNRRDLKALVIESKKSGIFIAGADLKGFEPAFKDRALAEKLIDKGQGLFLKLSKLPFPSIAAIRGACLGGGCELSLACTFRVASDSPKTQIGLPEVSLGLFPGWGGTQRAPRLVGLIQGMGLILGAKPVDAKKAFKIGLVDKLVADEFFDEQLEQFIAQVVTEKGLSVILKQRPSPLFDKTFFGPLFAFWKAKKDIIAKTKGHYKAPFAALRAIQGGFFLPLEMGLKLERDIFIGSIDTDLSQAVNLIRLFFNNEAVTKHPGGPEGGKAIDVPLVGVIGAGTMGAGISFAASNRDIFVRFKDVSSEMIAKGYGAIWSSFEALMKIRRLRPNEASLKFHKVSGTTDYSGFSKAKLVIEAATENIALKHKIFAELEEILPKDAIIASNTSSLKISELASQSRHPERFVGMHFFNPVPRMPLVEVVAGEKTSPDAVKTAVEFCKRLKKTPIVVKDCSGFLVNRIFVMGVVETMGLLEEGVSMEKIARAYLRFGMPMDPFELADEVGNDVNLKVLESFKKAYPDRVEISKVVSQVVERGFLGKKVGKGFYLYEGRKKGGVNPEIAPLLPRARVEMREEAIMERVLFSMLAEAVRCLEEKIVEAPSHVDMALVLGTGFPPFRAGLLAWADSVGIGECVQKMRVLADEVHPRFRPPKLLETMAAEGRGFYPLS